MIFRLLFCQTLMYIKKLVFQLFNGQTYYYYYEQQDIGQNLKIKFRVEMNPHTKRFVKSVIPLNERNITPDVQKFTAKENLDTYNDSYMHAPSMKQFSQNSPLSTADYARKRNRDIEEHEIHARTLADINLELDNNMNQIIYLLGKRKNLIMLKKKKIKDDKIERMESLHSSKISDSNHFEFQNDADFLRISSFTETPKSAIGILGKIMQELPDFQGVSVRESKKSEFFWQKNKELQNQIDQKLAKLKEVDKRLERTNGEVIDICRKLDSIQENLKLMVGSKTPDTIQKVQPLFAAKNSNYQQLNSRVKQRQVVKDTKIEYVMQIRKILFQLKQLRQQRLRQIDGIFGSDNLWELQKISAGGKSQKQLTNAFEELLKIKEKDEFLQRDQHEAWSEIQSNSRQQEALYNQILRRQSDEAKAFHNYNKIVNQRIKYHSILKVFGADEDGWKSNIDSSELLKKFGSYKDNLCKLLDEDKLLKDGIYKTNDTTRTFDNILRSTQNQKQRRHQLLGLLETCLKRRTEYEMKKEQLRNIMIQQTKNQQQKTYFEEELQIILSDGDIDSYKKIGDSLGKCENDRLRLIKFKELIDKELQQMDNQAVSLATKIQQEYQDILCEIIPSDYEYSLKNGQDVKKIRNFIRKMYKRLGILKGQDIK